VTATARREKEFRPNVRTNSERNDFAEHANGTGEIFDLSMIYVFFSEASLKNLLSIAGNILFPIAAIVSFFHLIFAWIGWGHGHRGMVNRNWEKTSNAIFQTLKGAPLGICITGNVIGNAVGVTIFAPLLPWIFIATLSTTAAYCLVKGLFSIFKAYQAKNKSKQLQADIIEAEIQNDAAKVLDLKSAKAHQDAIKGRYKTDLKYCTIGFVVTTTLCLAVAFVTFVPGLSPGFAIAAVIVCGLAGIYGVYEFVKNRRDLAKKQKIGPTFKTMLEQTEAEELLQEEVQRPTIAQKHSTAWHDFYDSAEHAAYMASHCRNRHEKRDYMIHALCLKLIELAPKVGNTTLVSDLAHYCDELIPAFVQPVHRDQLTQHNRTDLGTLKDSLGSQLNAGVTPTPKGFNYEQKKALAQRAKHQAKFRVNMWMLQTLCKEKDEQNPCFVTETPDEKDKRGYNKELGDNPLRHIIAKDILMANKDVLKETKAKCTQSFFRADSDTKKLMEAMEYYLYPHRFPQYAEKTYDAAVQACAAA